VAFSIALPVEINNSVPTSQVRFQQFCITKRFWVEGSNKRSRPNRGALYDSSNDLEFFIDRTFRALVSSFPTLSIFSS